MPRPRVYKTEAIVLRQQSLGEADRIVTLLSPVSGKVRAVARGVRRPKSKLGGYLELLNRVHVSIEEGRSLDHVTEAEILDSRLTLKEDLGRLSAALYMAEASDAFSVEDSPSHEAYRLLGASLAHLEVGAEQAPLLRYFELRLLSISGFRPELYCCVNCREDLQPARHTFSHEESGVVCSRCRREAGGALTALSVRAMKALRYLDRQPLGRALALDLSDQTWSEVGRVLGTQLRHVAERDIRSASFMRRLSSAGGVRS